MNILLLNDGYFQDSLRRLGHNVFLAGPSAQADLKVGDSPVPIGVILRRCPFDPDFVLLSDSIDYRAAFTGLEEIEASLAFFGVDATMNQFWQRDIGLAFDVCFLDQKSPVDELRAAHPERADRFQWLPLGADPSIYHKMPLSKDHDFVFVGSLHPVLRPKRNSILKTLQRHFDVAVFDGANRRAISPENVAQIYNQARIVLNENLFPGLNLRLLEAMSCGTCLLTEESDRSWQEFFRDGEHLVSFNSENLLERAAALRADADRRERIAAQGMDLVRTQHTIDHRALALLAAMVDVLRNPPPRSAAVRKLHLGRAYLALSARWPKQPVGKMKDYAIYLLEEAESAGANRADIYYEFTAQALAEGRRVKAGGWLERALAEDSNHLRSIWASFWRSREMDDHPAAAAQIVRMRQALGLEAPRRAFYDALLAEQDLTAYDYLELGKILEAAGWYFDPGVERSAAHPCYWNAFDAYQKAIALSPQLSESYLRCADVLERYGCEEFSLPFIEKAAALEPDDATLRLRLARLLLRNYRREEGCQQLRKYLYLSSEMDKWEKAESLRLTESEWNDLLRAMECSVKPQLEMPEESCPSNILS